MDRKFLVKPAEGKLMGVSAGIADYFGIDVTLVRLAWVLGFFISAGTALLFYLITGLVADSAR
ncbi:PspC domain-containing protein [Sphingomicrobium aestuariivivum]|uniref:PspC domain-containing protein n=1 Tax=Sphingomicrobium aestuariivivum TaxID=1582356 RepID=UPI001FD713C5|nr:PspC domain-containing protein [Sphingomicrobium aestuariivivum]MCJ8191091.1 PspC domain-containing protein [Sphingomicrobium aestuariivivum]